MGPGVAGDNDGVSCLAAIVQSNGHVVAGDSVDSNEDGKFRVEPRQPGRPGHAAASDMEDPRKSVIVSKEVQAL